MITQCNCRIFDTALLLQVIKMIKEQGHPCGSGVPRSEAGDSAVRRWLAQYEGERNGKLTRNAADALEQQRIRQLRRENQRLKEDVALLKSVGFLRPGHEVMQTRSPPTCARKPLYLACVRCLSQSLGLLCSTQQTLDPSRFEHAGNAIASSSQTASGLRGSRRLSKAMQARGFAMRRHRTRTLMKRLELHARWRRKFRHTTDSKHRPAGRRQHIEPSLQSGCRQQGMGKRHHLHPYGKRLVASGCGAGSAFTQSGGLVHVAKHACRPGLQALQMALTAAPTTDGPDRAQRPRKPVRQHRAQRIVEPTSLHRQHESQRKFVGTMQ